MKKILLTILAFIYFALAVRATVHLHDCIDIFSGSSTDTHSGQAEKLPCKNDPRQCKFETEHRINEAPLKSYRALDEVMVPVFAFLPPKVYITSDYNPDQYSTAPRQQVSLFILLRVIRR